MIQQATSVLAAEVQSGDRMLTAMGLVEQASELLALACEELNRVEGARPEYERTIRLHGGVFYLINKVRDKRAVLRAREAVASHD